MVGEGGNIQNNSLRSLFAEQQALGRFKCVEFNSTPSLATLDSEWYPFNFMNPLPDESALKIHYENVLRLMDLFPYKNQVKLIVLLALTQNLTKSVPER